MIIAAGLTPAWQRILVLDQVRLGEVNRARAAVGCASGKVLNVGIALHRLGALSKTVSVLGGRAGDAIRSDCAEMTTRWIAVKEQTRVCTTLIDEGHGQTTELVENAGPVQPAEIEAFLAALREEPSSFLVLSGSLPPGAPVDLYRRALENFTGSAILDIRGPELLEALALRPFLVKPNREELAITLGRSRLNEGEALEAMHELNRQGAQWVIVTDGAGPVLVTHQGRHQSFQPPSIQGVVNPIGCGDCLAAGIADGLERGREMNEAIRWGMACAAANLSQLLPARLDRQDVRRLFEGA